MSSSNFCRNCSVRLTRKGWRALIRGSLCDDCALRIRPSAVTRNVVAASLIALSAFAFGRYLRPKPPPLIIQRVANSPLSDVPIDVDALARRADGNPNPNNAASSASVDDSVYICGARTKKGTPCRRRVHFAGERCYQHKGMPAMVPLEKLTIKPDSSKK